ncbi:hypothetical protein [Bacteriovorax sp. DB6_IX]|uniref:hypothetical protein n=1 Tax=Bacteriovorax sp. DB6_IX TaxID=1353530 RepID=UPI00038A4A2B|nr:hypothetical protein [Bacteriovorax sp. DB6_IX]EQC51563.1 hypothetical protein M901_2723 [Bacteriovorax sp. DB6_IX]
MRHLCFLLSLIYSSMALSFGFSGVWIGSGEGQTPTTSFNCSEVEMRIHIEEDKLILRGGHYNCDSLSAEYPYSVFTIKDGVLFERDQAVGTIDEQTILLESPKDGFEMTLNLYNGSLYFNEAWVDGEDYLVLGAELKRIAN